MATPTPLSYLWVTATQASNDAYVQASISTGLLNQTGLAYSVKEILWEFPSLGGASLWNAEMQLAVKSAAAMSGTKVADKTVLARQMHSMGLLTSGGGPISNIERQLFTDDYPLYLVNDPLYLQCDSNATAASNIFCIRIGYEVVKLSDVLRLSLVAASLS